MQDKDLHDKDQDKDQVFTVKDYKGPGQGIQIDP